MRFPLFYRLWEDRFALAAAVVHRGGSPVYMVLRGSREQHTLIPVYNVYILRTWESRVAFTGLHKKSAASERGDIFGGRGAPDVGG